MFLSVKKNIFAKLKSLESYKRLIIEEFIPGREIQAAIIGKKNWVQLN